MNGKRRQFYLPKQPQTHPWVSSHIDHESEFVPIFMHIGVKDFSTTANYQRLFYANN